MSLVVLFGCGKSNGFLIKSGDYIIDGTHLSWTADCKNACCNIVHTVTTKKLIKSLCFCVWCIYIGILVCPCHLKASLTMWNHVLLHCFTVKTCVQIVINPCLVAVILKEDCCGTIVAELGTLMWWWAAVTGCSVSFKSQLFSIKSNQVKSTRVFFVKLLWTLLFLDSWPFTWDLRNCFGWFV